MSVYSNTEIKVGLAAGHIVIHPFIEVHLGGSSYDLTLGKWYFRTERSGLKGIYNPFDQEDVARYFGKHQKAIAHKDWCKQAGRQLFANIPPGHPIIVLQPGERILAHTNEFVGIKPPGTTEMRARSSWGRNGVAACFDAGWGDPGYINRWTMEVYNLNQNEAVPLPVGERISQMIFHHTGPVEGDYAQQGKYQQQADLQRLMLAWKPEDMLPRAYKDIRKKPTEVRGAR
jgi:dCTP deaminase